MEVTCLPGKCASWCLMLPFILPSAMVTTYSGPRGLWCEWCPLELCSAVTLLDVTICRGQSALQIGSIRLRGVTPAEHQWPFSTLEDTVGLCVQGSRDWQKCQLISYAAGESWFELLIQEVGVLSTWLEALELGNLGCNGKSNGGKWIFWV